MSPTLSSPSSTSYSLRDSEEQLQTLQYGPTLVSLRRTLWDGLCHFPKAVKHQMTIRGPVGTKAQGLRPWPLLIPEGCPLCQALSGAQEAEVLFLPSDGDR